MNKPGQTTHIEPRWPPALAVIAVLLLLGELPGRLRVAPVWVPAFAGIAVIVPMAAVALAPGKARWLRIERTITFLFFAIMAIGTVASLRNLIDAILRHPEVGGIQLLSSSIAIWVTNVLMFSLLYWRIDGGGPDARANRVRITPDWLFPQAGVPGDVVPNWRASFVDYLFLGYTTATAFSPTDSMPLTARAKMLMMFESTISLVTLAVVAARAINILK